MRSISTAPSYPLLAAQGSAVRPHSSGLAWLTSSSLSSIFTTLLRPLQEVQETGVWPLSSSLLGSTSKHLRRIWPACRDYSGKHDITVFGRQWPIQVCQDWYYLVWVVSLPHTHTRSYEPISLYSHQCSLFGWYHNPLPILNKLQSQSSWMQMQNRDHCVEEYRWWLLADVFSFAPVRILFLVCC